MKLISVIAFSLITLIQTAVAQQGSAYTRFGLGDIQSSYSARRLGMGQLGTSVADEDFIGTLNPAGWNLLKMTRVEFGVAYNGLSVSADNFQKKILCINADHRLYNGFPSQYYVWSWNGNRYNPCYYCQLSGH
jgi:hypothetical protein